MASVELLFQILAEGCRFQDHAVMRVPEPTHPPNPPGLSPRALLRLDAAGAAVSIVMLGFVLRTVLPITGMPTNTLALLALIPVSFLGYDLLCLRTGRADLPAALGPIAALNAMYCVTSIACLMASARELTPMGWAYFVGEIAVVATLAAVQAARSFRTAP